MLKIEPGTLKETPVPLVPGPEDAFEDLDRKLREGREEEAREIADHRVLREGLGLGSDEVKCLRLFRSELMAWRRPSRRSNGHA